MDAVEDGTWAVEGVANPLVVCQRWSWSACPSWQTVWTCSYLYCMSILSICPKAGSPLTAFSSTLLAYNCLFFIQKCPSLLNPGL